MNAYIHLKSYLIKGQVKPTLCFRLHKVHGHKKGNIAAPLEQQKDNFCITDEKENYWNSLGASLNGLNLISFFSLQ
jgi:hypothetical protein